MALITPHWVQFQNPKPRAAGGLTSAVFVLKSTDLTYLHVCPLLDSILPTTLLRCSVLSCFHAGDDTQGISATDCASSPLLSWWGRSGSSGVTKRLRTLRQAGVLCFIVFRVRQLGCSKDLYVHAHASKLAHVCTLTPQPCTSHTSQLPDKIVCEDKRH